MIPSFEHGAVETVPVIRTDCSQVSSAIIFLISSLSSLSHSSVSAKSQEVISHVLSQNKSGTRAQVATTQVRLSQLRSVQVRTGSSTTVFLEKTLSQVVSTLEIIDLHPSGLR